MKKVIVIGDGIVGLLSALTSAKYNHDVTLINIGKQANKESKTKLSELESNRDKIRNEKTKIFFYRSCNR